MSGSKNVFLCYRTFGIFRPGYQEPETGSFFRVRRCKRILWSHKWKWRSQSYYKHKRLGIYTQILIIAMEILRGNWMSCNGIEVLDYQNVDCSFNSHPLSYILQAIKHGNSDYLSTCKKAWDIIWKNQNIYFLHTMIVTKAIYIYE